MPYGRILSEQSSGRAVNQGRARRHDLVAFGTSAVALSRYDVTASQLPVAIELLERHPDSDQAFFALGSARALVVVASTRADGAPDLSAVRAFIADHETPFLYRAGTWHAPLFALERPARFVMAMSETGTSEDCETHVVRPTLLIR